MNAAAVTEDDFIPFGPATPGGASKTDRTPALNLVTGSGAGNNFSPLQTTGNSAHGAGKGHGAATLTLQKDGDVITGIRVECACGQVIDLACAYREASGKQMSQ